MNSKSKIWQIVLLVLLVLAIAAILFFNNKLNASKATLSDTMAQLTEEQAKGSLRLTVVPENTEEETDEAVRAVKEIVEDLRSMFRG